MIKILQDLIVSISALCQDACAILAHAGTMAVTASIYLIPFQHAFLFHRLKDKVAAWQIGRAHV